MAEEKVTRSDEQNHAVDAIKKTRTGIVLTGQVKDGKVILDQSSIEEVQRNFTNQHIRFVAVNAPFDPQSRSATVEAQS